VVFVDVVVETDEDTAAAVVNEEVLALEQCFATVRVVLDKEHGMPDRCWRSCKARRSVVQMWAQRSGTASGQGVIASADDGVHWCY
jgi:hypothetical protein